MKRNILAVASLLALTLAFGFAGRAQDQPANSNVAGTWQLTFEGRNGTVNQTLTLTQNGAALTGTVHSDRGDGPVTGTITGSTIDFTVKRTTPNGDFTSEFKGTVTGDAMKGTVMMGQNSRDWSATRQAQTSAPAPSTAPPSAR